MQRVQDSREVIVFEYSSVRVHSDLRPLLAEYVRQQQEAAQKSGLPLPTTGSLINALIRRGLEAAQK